MFGKLQSFPNVRSTIPPQYFIKILITLCINQVENALIAVLKFENGQRVKLYRH